MCSLKPKFAYWPFLYFVGHSNIFVEGLHVIKVYQESHYQTERVNQFLGRARKRALNNKISLKLTRNVL